MVYSDAKSQRSGDVVGLQFGGLCDRGVGALGGTHGSTDMGKITALVLLDRFRKLIADAQAHQPQ